GKTLIVHSTIPLSTNVFAESRSVKRGITLLSPRLLASSFRSCLDQMVYAGNETQNLSALMGCTLGRAILSRWCAEYGHTTGTGQRVATPTVPVTPIVVAAPPGASGP